VVIAPRTVQTTGVSRNFLCCATEDAATIRYPGLYVDTMPAMTSHATPHTGADFGIDRAGGHH